MVTLYIILKIKEILFSTLHVGKSTSLEITSNAMSQEQRTKRKCPAFIQFATSTLLIEFTVRIYVPMSCYFIVSVELSFSGILDETVSKFLTAANHVDAL